MNQYHCYLSTNFVAYTLQLTHLAFQMFVVNELSPTTLALINGIRISSYFTGSCNQSNNVGNDSLHVWLVSQLHHLLQWYSIGVSNILFNLLRKSSISLCLQYWCSDKRWDDVLIIKASISLSLYRSNWYGWAICMLLSESIKLIQGRGNTGPSWLSCTSVCVLLVP